MTPEERRRLKKLGVFLGPKFSQKAGVLQCEPPVSIGCDINMSGRIGAYTYIRADSRISTGVSSIGRYCSIAPGLTAGDSNHPMDWLSTHPFQWGLSSVHKSWTKLPDHQHLKMKRSKKKIIIENDVWIGAGVMIMPGVTISNGAVIGAGSVVTKDVPPYAIVAGVPAKVIKYRFSQEVIDELLRLQWWQYDADSILNVKFDDINQAISDLKELVKLGRVQKILEETVEVKKDSAQ